MQFDCRKKPVLMPLKYMPDTDICSASFFRLIPIAVMMNLVEVLKTECVS